MKFPNLPFTMPFGRPSHGNTVSSDIPVDLRSLNRTILNALRAVGLKTGLVEKRSVHPLPARDTFQDLYRARVARARVHDVIDIIARAGVQSERSAPAPLDADAQPPAPRGTFVTHSHTSRAGTRSYKLYSPALSGKEPMPLVIMLHGCTQSPDDFAAGTRMNEVAERYGFFVAYPEQAANANGSNCWNWYRAQDQSRDSGEPSLIAGITRDIVRSCPVDTKRVFVAGLSAGGAMAVILAHAYPDLYAAIGVHSGLPYGAAHDVSSAFAAMKTDPGTVVSTPASASKLLVPTIVFHGDHDVTVNAGNSAQIVLQTLAQASEGHATEAPLEVTEYAGSASGGRRYTRTVYRDPMGRPLVEGWLVHGAAHAWAGGSDFGSYTDPAGPDASEAMIQFFLSQIDVTARGHAQ